MLRDERAGTRRATRRLLLLAALAFFVMLVYVLRVQVQRRPPESLGGNDAGNAFIYTTETPEATSYWLGNADKPAIRTLLQVIPHAEGWAGKAALSPDGRFLAYTRLPRGSSEPDTSSELWWMGISERRPTRIAEAVDLRSALVWSPDASSITFQRLVNGRSQVWRQRVDGGTAKLMVQPALGSVFIPVGYAAAGSELIGGLYDAHGTDLVRIEEQGEAVTLTHLSDRTARGLTLDTQTTEIAFLAPEGSPTGPTMRGEIVDLAAKTKRQLPADWGEIVGIAWETNGRLTAGTTGATRQLRDESGESVLREQVSGFLQPLAWSPSGRFLAAREFSGDSSTAPGVANEVIEGSQGVGVPIRSGINARFVAWLGASQRITNG